MKGRRRKICKYRDCGKRIPESRRVDADYCGDDCKREEFKARRLVPQARRFWRGYRSVTRRRPHIRSGTAKEAI